MPDADAQKPLKPPTDLFPPERITRTPKQHATEALEEARKYLSDELTPVQRTVARGLVDYALEQVALIEETKRPRRERKKGTT
jgi:hypothetical protein